MAFRGLFRVLSRRTSPLLYTTASVFVKCAEAQQPPMSDKIQWEQPDLSKFTHEQMIKQSTVNTVNSVSQALTITYTAIETTSTEYRRSLALLLSLLRETLSYRVSDSHWDMIIAARSEVQKRKQTVTQLVDFMNYVEKMAVAATEACYMAGMDNLSMTLARRMDDALNNMAKEVRHNELLEKEYTILQEECIRKSNADQISEKNGDGDVEVETILVD